ncbi:MAG: hypothetical protein ACI977_000209 [Candidatus Nanohaloarchaea archaeon]|jgi:hypothetical protein
MKKLVLTLTVLLSVGLSTAVVGGPNPDDGGMAITSGGSAEATTSVNKNGTEYTSYFSVTNVTQTNDTGVTNSSFDGDTVTFTGVYQTPTPCYELNHEVERNGNSYNFDVTPSETGNGTCAQVVTYHKYDANFTADHAYKLNVTHDGEDVEVISHPGLEDRGQRGFFAQLLGALISLIVS